MTPFYSGRTMPSKWEDAERWICSPVLGYGVAKYSQCQPQRRPKSKSGPIVPPGIAYYSNYSPSMQVLDSGSVRNFIASSPFSTGVLMPNGSGVHYNGDGIGGQAIVARSASGPGWLDLASECSSPSSHGILNPLCICTLGFSFYRYWINWLRTKSRVSILQTCDVL